jgi:type I restriction enzyme S subunit
MMGHAPYSKYVASDATAVPQLPSHWKAKRLRYVCSVNPSKSEIDLPGDASVSFIPMDAVGEYGRISHGFEKSIDEVGTGYTYFADGDVVIAKITPCFENGKGALAENLTNGIAFGTTELHVVRATSEIDSRFLFYISISDHFRKVGESEMYGAGGQKRVPDSFIKDFRLGIPPRNEQITIVGFLDGETARIDSLIVNKLRLLKLLDERRRAVIGRAVTKGLNPFVPMRDSGISWLGNVPAHWTSSRLKFACERIIDCKNRTPEENFDGSFFVVRTTCIRNGKFYSYGGYQTDEQNFIEWTQRGIPRSDDVLFTREAPTGEACLPPVDLNQFCLGQRMMALRSNHDLVIPEFLVGAIYGPLVRYQVESRSKGSTVGHLRVGEVGDLPCLLPPIDEQWLIVQHIRTESERIDAMKDATNNTISKLQEYRSALITDAVTGKINVHRLAREEAAA